MCKFSVCKIVETSSNCAIIIIVYMVASNRKFESQTVEKTIINVQYIRKSEFF